MNRRNVVIAATVVTLVGFAGLIAFARHTHAGGAPNPLRPVRVAVVESVPLGAAVRAVGLLGPKDEARLGFKVGGVIEAIEVEAGAPVKAGQLLAILKQTEIAATLEQARQAAGKASRDLARGKALYADGVATEEQVQDLTTADGVARAALRTAEFNSTYARIVAPSDGVVLQKLAAASELVQAGQPVLVVGGAGRGWVVRAGLADRDLVRVRLGDLARIEFDAFPGRVFAGRIGNVASSADPATGTFMVEVQVEPGEARFVQGLVAKLSLSPRDATVAQVVPITALIEANGSEASVFVLDRAAKVVHRLSVRIGRLSEGRVELLDALPTGTEVVIDGAAFLENGEAVRIAADEPATARQTG